MAHLYFMKAVVNQQYGTLQREIKHSLFLKDTLHTLTHMYFPKILLFFLSCLHPIFSLFLLVLIQLKCFRDCLGRTLPPLYTWGANFHFQQKLKVVFNEVLLRVVPLKST